MSRKSKIEFIKKITSYGEKELGLDFKGSFEQFSSRSRTANWLYVSSKDHIKSMLPENATYLFSWDTTKLAKKEKYYKAKRFHTYLFKAEAHGGGKCPITPSLLEATPARQLYVVLHEGWHSTLSAKGLRIPYSIEESSGRLVGIQGAVGFCKWAGDKDILSQVFDQAKAWKDFAFFINTAFVNLGAGTSAAALHAIKIAATRLSKNMPQSWEKAELSEHDINNAFILRYHDYTGHYPLCLKLLKRFKHLNKTIKIMQEVFKTSVEKSLNDYI